MTALFAVLFLAAGAANLAFSILLLRTLAASGIRVSFFEIRWQVHRHLKTYKELTRRRSGRVGSAYYGYVGTAAALVVFAILLFLSI